MKRNLCNEPGCEQEGIPCTEPMGWSRREGLRDLNILLKRHDYREFIYQTYRWLRWGFVTVITYYCPSHCQKNGFCYLCGQFRVGGDEHFDFSGTGVCSECRHEFDEYDPDAGRDFDDDDDLDEWDDVIAWGPDAA